MPGGWGNSAANKGEGGKSMRDGVKPKVDAGHRRVLRPRAAPRADEGHGHRPHAAVADAGERARGARRRRPRRSRSRSSTRSTSGCTSTGRYVYADAIYSTPIISLAAGADRALEELAVHPRARRQDLPDPRRAGAHLEGPQVVRAGGVRPVLGRGRAARHRRRHALRRLRLPALRQRVGGHHRRDAAVQVAGLARVPGDDVGQERRCTTAWRRSSATAWPPASRSSSSCRSSTGSGWIRPFVAAHPARPTSKSPVLFDEDPFEVFKRNIYVHIFHEPDPQGLLDLGLPADRLMFGSDFPHPEGMGDPLRLQRGRRGPAAGGPGAHHGRHHRQGDEGREVRHRVGRSAAPASRSHPSRWAR